MSLTSLTALKDVVDRIKPFRPKGPRKIPAALRVAPHSKRYTLVGTAVDYLLRFELQRRAAHAVSVRWVAEGSLEVLCHKSGSATVYRDLLDPMDPSYLSPQEVFRHAQRIVSDAKSAVGTYSKSSAPDNAAQTALAEHAIRLAKLDSIYRGNRLDPQFREAAPEDVQDLLELLRVVPFDALVDARVMLLNPNFADASRRVGGADTDLVTGDMLVDFKTTQKDEIEGKHLDQLFGYFLLARKHRETNPSFPEIRRVGIYYCRHGHLWEFPTSRWTNLPEFPNTEEWFWNRAEQEFGVVTKPKG